MFENLKEWLHHPAYRRASIADDSHIKEKCIIEVYRNREIYWFFGEYYTCEYRRGIGGVLIPAGGTNYGNGIYIVGGNLVLWMPFMSPERVESEMKDAVIDIRYDIDHWVSIEESCRKERELAKDNKEKIRQQLNQMVIGND